MTYFTEAPKSYDGFGTRTTGSTTATTAYGIIRIVEIADEHVEWQTARYGSGGYVALTAKQFFANYPDETIIQEVS